MLAGCFGAHFRTHDPSAPDHFTVFGAHGWAITATLAPHSNFTKFWGKEGARDAIGTGCV